MEYVIGFIKTDLQKLSEQGYDLTIYKGERVIASNNACKVEGLVKEVQGSIVYIQISGENNPSGSNLVRMDFSNGAVIAPKTIIIPPRYRAF
jgi:hypothetical protein